MQVDAIGAQPVLSTTRSPNPWADFLRDIRAAPESRETPLVQKVAEPQGKAAKRAIRKRAFLNLLAGGIGTVRVVRDSPNQCSEAGHGYAAEELAIPRWQRTPA